MTWLVSPVTLLFSTINAYTLLFWLFLAQIIRISLFPLPIHLLVPLSLYWVAFILSARVLRLDASEPILSSVNPHPPINSKFFNFGKYVAFCYSLPRASIVYITRAYCTSTIVHTPASPLASSAIIAPWANVDNGFPYGGFKNELSMLVALSLGIRYSGNLAYST